MTYATPLTRVSEREQDRCQPRGRGDRIGQVQPGHSIERGRDRRRYDYGHGSRPMITVGVGTAMITVGVVPVPLPRQRVAADQRPLIPTLPSPCAPGQCDRRGSGRADDHAGSTGIRSCTGRGPRGDKRGVPPQCAPAPDEPRGGGGPLRRGEPRGSDRLSPQMVGELAAACRALHARQGWLRLIATAPCVVSVLESAAVEDLFPIYRAARTEFREVS